MLPPGRHVRDERTRHSARLSVGHNAAVESTRQRSRRTVHSDRLDFVNRTWHVASAQSVVASRRPLRRADRDNGDPGRKLSQVVETDAKH